MFLDIIIILMLLAGLSLGVYTMNSVIIDEFKARNIKQAYIYLYLTMFGALIIVAVITFCFQNILIDVSNLFYRS
ncbi:hypothetical protein [Macrococcoides canis]|uniref:DUF1146 domain-containing protein n=1 Tax=Macrococcoides canis TaxID=1855823 RepID=A0A4R6C699_9STAP|nr:hypothetical protein [Macrococcus canis]MEE1106635.1 hypothetical protein [Macrococcus canis]TDM17323.1 hypothetical protein ETI04_05340 [Macrococcus canis]TDM20654.1 hypothetical protein ETI05_05230 [Macrococcus canis]TDM22347.1 hypothetical protein ETI02_10145 [Macrococcus canis]TDM33132.1 hypothetical protein ETI13_09580 [Macrococcus canis]